MSNIIKDSPFQALLREMPSLRHSVHGAPFDIARSEVVAWLVAQPRVQQWLYDKARYSGRLVFDEATGTWRGARLDETEAVLAKWREVKRKKKVPQMEVES